MLLGSGTRWRLESDVIVFKIKIWKQSNYTLTRCQLNNLCYVHAMENCEWSKWIKERHSHQHEKVPKPNVELNKSNCYKDRYYLKVKKYEKTSIYFYRSISI